MNYLSILLVCSIVAAKAQTCDFLDKNQVKANICTGNDKFWDVYGTANPSYEVPKGSQRHSQFANSIWIGGFDASGQLHLSAQTYRQNGTDFWPGPLDTSNIQAFTPTNSQPYQRVWKLDCNEINNFVQAFKSGAVTAGTYTVPANILNYPAQGSHNFQKNLSPYYDANNNGAYAPQTEGDHPVIRGHQQILSIFNDSQGTHTESGMPAMGLEIHQYDYVFSEPQIHDSMQAINYTTFHYYEIYNRSANNYNNVYVSDWADVDLGYYLNDYIGTDTVNNSMYCYNASNYDITAYGRFGYEARPPVSSHVLLPIDCSTDGIDNDQDGLTDETGEQFKLNHTSFYNSTPPITSVATTFPSMGLHYYHYMLSKWKDGTSFTYGGNAYGGTVPNPYVYTGNPQTVTGWTEGGAGNKAGDRAFLITSGPFNFPAKSKIRWGYAIVFSQDTTTGVNTISQFSSRVQRDVRNIKYYHANHLNPQCGLSGPTGIRKQETNMLQVMVYPNPGHEQLTVDLNKNVKSVQIRISDLTGREIRYEQVKGGKADINTLDLQPGIYFIDVRTSEGSATIKWIKN